MVKKLHLQPSTHSSFPCSIIVCVVVVVVIVIRGICQKICKAKQLASLVLSSSCSRYGHIVPCSMFHYHRPTLNSSYLMLSTVAIVTHPSSSNGSSNSNSNSVVLVVFAKPHHHIDSDNNLFVVYVYIYNIQMIL